MQANKILDEFAKELEAHAPPPDRAPHTQPVLNKIIGHLSDGTVKVEPMPWDEPIPFEAFDPFVTPEFPIESLPAPIAALVEALADSTQTPVEMSAALSLGVLATAFQSRYTVEITSDWKEPLCLYIAVIARPGERKTAVISVLTAPIYEFEEIRRETEAVEIAKNQQERRMLEKELQNAEAAATKFQPKPPNTNARQNALDLSERLATFEDKHPYRLLVDDTTPEKLIDVMDKQNGCITVASAEGGVFDAISGRYDNGANFDIYLKGHAGDPVTVDRIGRKSNHIKHPRLTMLLTIQPDVLTGLMDNVTLRGRGLCGRFLYASCKSKVGFREINPEPVPDAVKAEYNNFIGRILSGRDKGILHLSPEAHEVRLSYMSDIEKRLGNEWENMTDWGGKLVGAMLRIAALIHAAEAQGRPTETPVSAETVTAAVKIAEFFGAHATAAYQVMGADEAHENAKYLLRRIKSDGRDEISKRDLYRLCKGKFKKAEDMEPALQMLIDMYYIREIEQSTGGRPTRIINVNPRDKRDKRDKTIEIDFE